jgi:hypothetical protein
MVAGVQVVFSSFFMTVLGLNTTGRHPPGALAQESGTGDGT